MTQQSIFDQRCTSCQHVPHAPGKCAALVGDDAIPAWVAHKRCKCTSGFDSSDSRGKRNVSRKTAKGDR